MSLISFFILETFLSAVLAGLTFLFFHYFRRLPARSLPANDLPFVTVIVPARNEEGKIRRCLESLALQDYPNYEVIAVNDRSTDATGEIIESISEKHPRVKCIQGKEAPPGWLGKCSALVQAVKHASPQSNWFLFTDADTCHTPNSLRYSMSYAVDNKAELISFMPVQELYSFWEQAVMPVLLGSFLCGDPLNTINEHTNERAYAYGQYILVRRDVYEHVGGHESVHDQILDDISLARVTKKHGYHITSADGRLLYKVRMYTDLVSLWHGWTKNLYALIDCNVSYLLTVLVLLNIAILAPFVSTAILLEKLCAGESVQTLLTLASFTACQFALLVAWYRRCSEHYIGVDWRHFFLLPIGSIAVSMLYLHSAFLVHSGNKVSWKGRSYVVHTSKAIDGSASDENKSNAAKEQSAAVS